MSGGEKLVEWSTARRLRTLLDRRFRIECRRSWKTFRTSWRSEMRVYWRVPSRAGRGPSRWQLWRWLFSLLEGSAPKKLAVCYWGWKSIRTHAIIIKISSARTIRKIPHWEISRSIMTTLEMQNSTHRPIRLSVWCILIPCCCCWLGSFVDSMTNGKEWKLATHLRRDEE